MLLFGRYLIPVLIHSLDVVRPSEVVDPEQNGLTTKVENPIPSGFGLDCKEQGFAFFSVPVWVRPDDGTGVRIFPTFWDSDLRRLRWEWRVLRLFLR